ncbi:MAG: 4Fe-4S dicluster domain-containing protein [Candidatus Thorarchaeota archaeon]|nr:MAG: hydrogenase [Candidatus Thorarchaeota archaeon]RLI58660.1 MAG: hydrogenase [Candidatus Thorarchaeota archaeon]
MRILKMQAKYLEVFLESLDKFGVLYGPIRKRGVLTFDRVERVSDLVLGGEHPMIPLKKLFHPKQFTMMHFNEKGFSPDYSIMEKRVVIGAHPCEIHGLLRLDDVFLSEPADPYYAGLRKSTAIIGFSCLPTENSLCSSTRTDIVEEGFDLFFVDLDDFYLVWVGSSLGHDMIYEREEFFDENVAPEDIQRYLAWREKRNKMFKHHFEFKSMPDVMELSYNSKIWEEFADKCLSCGQCSMVCPTCNCFNVTDILDITNEAVGRRERVWDSCMFADYSLVSGGHNFREARADRLKLWYTHKLKAFGDEYGTPGCVGCGRCVDTCPVDINVLTISEALTTREVPTR